MNDIQEYKLNVNVEPIAGYHMDELNIKCVLFVYTNKAVEVGNSNAKLLNKFKKKLVVKSASF